MGSLKKFATWLSGGPGSGGKNPATRSITQLKVFVKRLQRQSSKLNSQSKVARRKAVEMRKQGDMNGSKIYMKSSLQSKKWGLGIDNYVLQIQGLQFKLEQAKSVNDVAEILKGVASSIASLQSTVSAPQISELVEQIDIGIQDFDVVQEMTEDGLTTMNVSEVTDEDVDSALAEIDSEISVETGQALPAAGEGKISEIEKEIQRLKEGK